MSDKPTIYHCVDLFDSKNEYDRARKAKARATWEVLYQNHGVVPCYYEKYARDSRAIGCSKALPYLRDVLAHGMTKAESDDSLIMWSNDDDCLHENIGSVLRNFIALYGACTAQRREFKNTPYPTYTLPPEQLVGMSQPHIGRDLICASKRWLLQHWAEIPDCFLGAGEFDLQFATMVRRHKGFNTTHMNLYEVIQCCELPLGYVGHDWHASSWGSNDLANAHNHQQFLNWRNRYYPELKLPL